MPITTREGFATKAIHAGQDPLQWSHCSVVPPLVMSTTFRQDAPAQHRVRINLPPQKSLSSTLIFFNDEFLTIKIFVNLRKFLNCILNNL